MGVLDNLFSKTVGDERFNVLKTFYEKSNLSMKSDLTDKEIIGIVLIEYLDKFLADDWNLKLGLDEVTKGIKAHKISRNRKGRAEMVEVLKGQDEEKGKDSKNMIRKILGM